MNFDTLLLGVADGISYAGLLFLVSLGLTLIFGVLGVLNIAHGSLFALGGYVAASLTANQDAPKGVRFDFGSFLR